MGLTIDTEVREKVIEHFIQQMSQASPSKQERIIRLLIHRLPRATVDGLYIAAALTSDSHNNTAESEQDV
jgi:hypothetical protein